MALVSRVFGFFAGAASGQSAGGVTDSVFELSKQNAWARRPYMVLPAEEAATAAAQELNARQRFTSLDGAGNEVQHSEWPGTAVDFDDDAIRGGTAGARFGVLRALAQNVPQVAEILELWRRGRVDESTVESVFTRLGYPPGLRPALKGLRYIVPSVTDMVRFAVREVYNPAQRRALDLDAEFPDAFADDATRVGIAGADARKYWAAHWELPSYTEGAQMLFRKAIDRDRFRALLKALDYAPTWRGPLEEIARAIPTMSDMIRFAVREVYNPAQRRALDIDAEYPNAFTAEAAKHGMREDDARDYWAAHWKLPSATQGFEMLHRGEIDIPELNGLLKALDYAPTWRAKMRAIAYRVPTRVDLRRMLGEGVIDRATVKAGYLHLGYTELWAERLTQFAEKLARPTATSGTDAYVARAENQLWGTLHRSYIMGETDDDAARAILGSLGATDDAQLTVLLHWDAERALTRKQLSPAQVRKAFQQPVTNPRTGVPWTFEDAYAELIQRGYSAEDARTFLQETKE